MPKRATAVLEQLDPKTMTLASQRSMAKRKSLAELLRERMLKPATAAEKKLWHEFKTEVERERLTFRS